MQNIEDGGEAIIQAFRSLGVDYVMASPGSEWSAVWEAFAKQHLSNTPGPTYLSCAHETLAVDMALGYTLYTGRMQAVMLHTGVGLLQGSMGIEGAQRGAIPVVVMSGEALSFGDDPNMDPGFQWQGLLNTVGSPVRFAEPLVKWANQASSIHTIYQQIVSAGELAQRTPRGPVYMTVPIEVMRTAWTRPAELRDAPPAPVVAATAADIEAVAKQLCAAENPAIITEEAGRDPAGYAALVELAEALSIPVVEARLAFYANFPREHPLHQGFHRPPVVDEADLILTIGCRAPWYPLSDTPKKARVIAIDDTPFRDHMVYQPSNAEMFLEGDIAANLSLLVAAVRNHGVNAGAVAERLTKWAAVHETNAAETRAVEAEYAGSETISPGLLAAVLSEAAPDDTIFVDETITHRAFLLRHLRNKGPQSYFRAHGGLGQGLGFALGIKLAAPNRPVVTTMGDGTFLYNPAVQAMAFAHEQGLATLTVVFNNRGYNAMRKDHQGYYPNGAAAQNDMWLGHPITEFDYAELARPFGAYGRTVETPAELNEAVAEAYAAIADGKAALLNVVLDA